MERRLILLLLTFSSLTTLALSLPAVPLFGLSTVLSSTVLGSSALGSTVLGSSILGSSALSTTILQAYSTTSASLQLFLSLATIATLIYLELTDPSYGAARRVFIEVRRSWLPVTALLVVLFSIIVAVRVWEILVA
ncbi:MAG: hypothetical protein N3H31_04920 [Candidatus Nezhaarchaeota archaeon]|nr:hypothetical protein [Candidatus Nezhaarchaeota archaeon]